MVNPRSGNDVRRVLASASSSTLEDKVGIVRRVVRGAREMGVREVWTMREPHRIVGRATETLDGITVHVLDGPIDNTEHDSTNAAAAMRDAGCAALVVLGGDGTNRAVAKGWPDVPVVPLSTGTNNAFPVWVEPTVAGVAVGLVATGAVAIDDVARAVKVVRVEIERRCDDTGDVVVDHELALVDAVAVDDPFVGSLELFDPETMRAAVLTRAEPAAIGFAAVGGLVEPLDADDPGGLALRFVPPATPGARRVLAPTAPGHFSWIGLGEVARLAPGDVVTVEGPTILAFDGERKRRLRDGDRARLWVAADGPRVIDVAAVVRAGVAAGRFRG